LGDIVFTVYGVFVVMRTFEQNSSHRKEQLKGSLSKRNRKAVHARAPVPGSAGT
jgi:hypothetical protein